MRRDTACVLCVAAGLMFGAATAVSGATTLDKIRAAGTLACGINVEEVEYSTEDAHGNHGAFDQDICRALAAAVLGSDAKLSVISFSDERDALDALRSGKIAVLATGSANYMNTAKAGFGFGPIVFYDYQGFLANKNMGIKSAKDLAGKKVCFLGGTEIEIELQGYMKREKIDWLPFSFQEEGEMEAALVTQNCAAVSADVSQLAYEQIAFGGTARNFQILPDVVAKDPLAPTYRIDDPQWAAIVNWTADALIQAEESGITRANVTEMGKSQDPVVQRVLGTWKGYAQYLGLRDGWAADVIRTVGNYGEIYERDLGSGSRMKLPRGPNNLWTNGGLIYALPIR